MTNANIMIDKAVAQSSPNYAAVGKILLAYNLNMATTAWEDIPYSQAFSIKNYSFAKPFAFKGFGKIHNVCKNVIAAFEVG